MFVFCWIDYGVHSCTLQAKGDHLSTIGERLREERERKGMNQSSFAEVGGVQKRAQINYEKDERHPDAAYLAAIAAAGVDVLYVLTGQRAPLATDQAYVAPSQHMTEKTNPVTHSVVAEPLGEYRLNQREKALIENYRGSDEEGRRAMESTASALAHKDRAKEKRQGGE
ncbi:helix-turn-helix domain-containing protein [Pseudomonas aeruginosa]|nr:helix-turn-helix domain-containing protein [Pseudomonas aeruginosa]MBS2806455.1 helix-turn-helix domain-containing protein [Pseudomonas aeruginosa]MBW3066665.1 helix-turn-helix domain-containing protein [Pseudomonas aeruginosa]MBW6055969.1 helix-turn-helix domain-containing protein [Pseudomonas aeruginosa]MBW6180743.1 helix-turn-helix domain-containing protein [Pseudomonas aeruginosa]